MVSATGIDGLKAEVAVRNVAMMRNVERSPAMQLRLAKTDEFEAVRDFYWESIDLMQDREDTVGWKKGIYPTDEFLRESIEKQELYVLDLDEKIAAAVIVNSDCNDGYKGIN